MPMGTWGYKLYDNDLFSDIKGDYETYLHKGKTPQEAVQLLCQDFIPNGGDEEPLFWVCLADLQWRYGHLDPEIKAKALAGLPSLWDPELWTDPADQAKRKALAEGLRKKLESPQPPPKKFSRYRAKKTKWKVGEVFSFQIYDFASPSRPQWLREKDVMYFPYSNKYFAFCVVDTKEVYDPDREVTDLLPVVAIFDLIKDEAPSIQDIVSLSFVKFYGSDRNRSAPPRYNCALCYIPSKTTLNLCNVQRIGITEQFVEIKDELVYYKSICYLNHLDDYFLDARLRRYG